MINSPIQRFAIVTIICVRQILIRIFKIIQTDAHDSSNCFTCEKGTDVSANSVWDSCSQLAQQEVNNKQVLSIRIVDSTNNNV